MFLLREFGVKDSLVRMKKIPTVAAIFSCFVFFSYAAEPDGDAVKTPPTEVVSGKISAGTPSKPTNWKSLTGDDLVALGWTDLGGLRGALLGGADPNARTRWGDYPIINFAYGGNIEALEVMLDFGASLSVVNRYVESNADALRTLSLSSSSQRLLKGHTVATAAIFADSHVDSDERLRMIQLLLEYGYPVNLRDDSGLCALHIAAMRNEEDIAKLLVAYGANGDLRSFSNGKNARDYARTSTMRLILRGYKFCEPTRRPTFGKIPLRLVPVVEIPKRSRVVTSTKFSSKTKTDDIHVAIENWDAELVAQTLADATQEIKYTADRKTPLHLLCQQRAIPFDAFKKIYILLENKFGKKILELRDQNEDYPIAFAVRNNRDDILKFLLSREKRQLKFRNGSNDDTLVHVAVRNGKLEVLRALIVAGADVNARNREKISKTKTEDYTPLHLAVRRTSSHRAEIVYLLLAAGANPDLTAIPSGKTALELLFSARADMDTDEIRRALIEGGSKLSLKDEKTGQTVLHRAAESRNTELVDFAISLGADVNAADASGNTPLHIAARDGSDVLVRKFIEAGSNINAKNKEQKTPLVFAIENGRTSVVRELCSRGADVKISVGRAKDRTTPLHLAASKNNSEIVKIILSAGAPVNAKNGEGKTPLDIATDAKVSALLTSAGARKSTKNRDEK